MTKKQLKELAVSSFIKNSLNARKVKKISSLLIRKELRQYLKFLKLINAKKSVRVIISNKTDKDFQDKILRNFSNKRVIFEEDKDLLLGVRIIDNDMLYDFNLKNEFNEIREFVANT